MYKQAVDVKGSWRNGPATTPKSADTLGTDMTKVCGRQNDDAQIKLWNDRKTEGM